MGIPREVREVDGTRHLRCSRCRIWKPEIGFHRDKAKLTGRCAFCRVCALERARRWALDHPEEYKARMKRYARERKEQAFAAYGGAQCTCCGEKIMAFLALDHVNGGGRRDHSGSAFYTELRKRGYPPGFQVLCHNCNFGRYLHGGTCPHKIPALEAVG